MIIKYMTLITLISMVFSSAPDSLKLSVITTPAETDVIINYNSVGKSPLFSEMIYFQNLFLIELKKDGYIPLRFPLDEPYGSYTLDCNMVSIAESERIQKRIDKLLFQRYRDPMLISAMVALIGGGALNNVVRNEWKSYSYLRNNGYHPSKDKIEKYVKRSEALIYSMSFFVSVPVLTNYRHIRSKEKKMPEYQFQHDYLKNRTRHQNAPYNFMVCFVGGSTLQLLSNTLKSRESTAIWQEDFPDLKLSDSFEFTANTLYIYGAMELINWILLKKHKPTINKYVQIRLNN